MPRQWVVNASPLIILGKIDLLHVLEGLAETLVVPTAVAQEIAAGPESDPARQWLAGPGKAHIRDANGFDRQDFTSAPMCSRPSGVWPESSSKNRGLPRGHWLPPRTPGSLPAAICPPPAMSLVRSPLAPSYIRTLVPSYAF